MGRIHDGQSIERLKRNRGERAVRQNTGGLQVVHGTVGHLDGMTETISNGICYK